MCSCLLRNNKFFFFASSFGVSACGLALYMYSILYGGTQERSSNKSVIVGVQLPNTRMISPRIRGCWGECTTLASGVLRRKGDGRGSPFLPGSDTSY